MTGHHLLALLTLLLLLLLAQHLLLLFVGGLSEDILLMIWLRALDLLLCSTFALVLKREFSDVGRHLASLTDLT